MVADEIGERPRITVTQARAGLDVTNLCRAAERSTAVIKCAGRIGLVAHNEGAHA